MTYTPHFNQAGEAHMVDVSEKSITHRSAISEGYIEMLPETLQIIVAGTHKKGDVLAVARIAGIMASKKTSELIPLCHPLPISHVELSFTVEMAINCIRCQTLVKNIGQTGIEIEALCATQIALLTIYDMCKAVDRGMVIRSVRLLEKDGGKSGNWRSTEVLKY